jgi:hypothetical protein
MYLERDFLHRAIQTPFTSQTTPNLQNLFALMKPAAG